MHRKPPHVCFDRYLPSHPMQAAHAARLAIITAKKWQPGDVLTISFFGGTLPQRANVAAACAELQKYANIKFNILLGGTGKIRIAFNPALGAWSNIGTDALSVPASQPTINLGFDQPGTYLHELTHALGAIHEHQSPFGNPIRWNRPQVYHDLSGPPNNWDQQTIDHNMFAQYDQTLLNGTTFDPKSIMLYSFPPSWTIDGFHVEPNAVLSDQDKQWLATQYPGVTTPPPPPQPPSNTTIVITKPGTYQLIG